ncbi:hypothetical protein BSPWISOXPB_10268 [uncultured Gammaproteobacteria bacterium]|nr:hypothetical protein BSPWISOXPB_10268 [uncultured Gammaproteobacteria bacterium]
MISTKKQFHLLGENQRQPSPSLTTKLYAFMNIINYKLDTTNEFLTSRIGLITPAHTIQVLDLSKTIDQHFPALGSNCALKAQPSLIPWY